MENVFDRSQEDVGNIVALEHINGSFPDQRLATRFYVTALGLTRDPYLMTGIENMWVNIGRSQFHIPTGSPSVLCGHVGIVLPDRELLVNRLSAAKSDLADTLFAFSEQDDFVDVTSPWGIHLRCFAPGPKFGPVNLAVAYVEYDVPVGTAARIARFYREVLEAQAEDEENEQGVLARCSVGYHQEFVYREIDGSLPERFSHHVQIYLANVSRPHAKLSKLGLAFGEVSQYQYRFQDIVDLDSGEVLVSVEHEVRSMTHPLYARPLVNRNATQNNNNYVAGHQDWGWHLDTSN